MTVRVLVGSALDMLRAMPSESVQCVVTSPPYYGLRAYGTDPQVWGGNPGHAHEWTRKVTTRIEMPLQRGAASHPKDIEKSEGSHGAHESAFCPCGAWRGELGSEPTPALFIEHMLLIFDEVKRVLRPDGLCFVNIGDSYSGSGKGPPGPNALIDHSKRQGFVGRAGGREAREGTAKYLSGGDTPGIPAKNLLLIPQRFAIGMQERGWWVRSEIVWAKASCMPESVRDRPTSSWEPIWMFAKNRSYFYDGDAVRQPHVGPPVSHYGTVTARPIKVDPTGEARPTMTPIGRPREYNPLGANLRNVWTLGPEPSRELHYAAYPTEIPKRCILAGSRAGDTVLDPFLGSGTTALVADRLGRDAIGIELSPAYAEMARRRIESDEMLFSAPVEFETWAQPDLFGETEGAG